jgi:hypothetical protein
MGVFVILEMDGSTDDLLAAAADVETRRPTSAILSGVVAPSETGVVVATFWGRREMITRHSQSIARRSGQAAGLTRRRRCDPASSTTPN